jgi:fucose permease
MLIVLALLVKYPRTVTPARTDASTGTVRAMKNGYVLAFSAGAFLYVGVEAAIYVWMPTLMAGYTGSAVTLATYSISIYFLLRAAGRFLGVWVLTRVQWQTVLALFSGGILLCFVLSVAGGVNWAVYLLPLSGLFMSVVYPTLNSKGISCLPKSDHGAAAGVILFFTCVSAVLAPLAIGAVGDAFGQIVFGFWLATGLAALLFIGLMLNWALNPTRAVLEQLDVTEYRRNATA